MPVDACQRFSDCFGCLAFLRPKATAASSGSVLCPPRQAERLLQLRLQLRQEGRWLGAGSVNAYRCCSWHLAVMTNRSEEHTSELQSLMRISYAVFCLKKKKNHRKHHESI